jgi:hypothetical protein
MKKFYFLQVIIFISLDLSAQQVQPSPPDWIRINAGDSFAIRTTVTHIGQKKTLVGTLLRIVGAGAAAYESGKFVETNLKKGKTWSMQNTWIPPAGVGLILFGDDIAGIKKPHTGFVGYTLFSNDKVALERNTVRLDNKSIRKNAGILLSGRAQQDGFLRIEGTQGEGKNVDILLDWMPGKTPAGYKAADLPLSPIAELPVSVKASVPSITPDIPLVPTASSAASSKSSIRVAPVSAGIKAAIPRTGSPARLTPAVIRPAKSLPENPVTPTRPSENNKKPAAPFLTTVDWTDERTEEEERNGKDEEFPGRLPIDFLKRLLTAKPTIEVDGYDGDEGGYGEDGNLGNDESGYDDSSDSDDLADGGGTGDDTDDSSDTDDSDDTSDSGYGDEEYDIDGFNSGVPELGDETLISAEDGPTGTWTMDDLVNTVQNSSTIQDMEQALGIYNYEGLDLSNIVTLSNDPNQTEVGTTNINLNDNQTLDSAVLGLAHELNNALNANLTGQLESEATANTISEANFAQGLGQIEMDGVIDQALTASELGISYSLPSDFQSQITSYQAGTITLATLQTWAYSNYGSSMYLQSNGTNANTYYNQMYNALQAGK